MILKFDTKLFRLISIIAVYLLITKEVAATGILIKHLTDLNGLPQNSIKAIARDQMGYLWVVTEHGVARFDGNNTKSFIDTSLLSNRYSIITPGRNADEFYAITDHMMVMQLNRGRLKKLKHDSIINDRYFYSGCQTSIWGIHQFYINDKGKRCYVGVTLTGALIMDDGQTTTPLPSEYEGNLFAWKGKLYSVDADLNINALKSFDINSAITRPSKETNTPRFPQSSILNSIPVFIFRHKVYSIDEENGKMKITELMSNIKDDENFNCVLYDKKTETLFLGTATNGLYIYKINSGIRIPEFTRNKSYAAQVDIGNDRIFAGGDIIGLDTAYSLPEIRKNIIQYATMKDHLGYIYYPSQSTGTYRLAISGLTKPPVKIFKETCVWIYEDKDHRIWMYDRNNVKIYTNVSADEKKLIYCFSRFNNIRGNMIFDPKERTYLMVNGAYLYKINEQLQLTDSLQIDKRLDIRCLFKSNTGIIWLGTYGHGVKCIQNRNIYSLPLDHEKNLLIAHEIFQDHLSNYWITTNKGLFKFKAGEVENKLFNQDGQKISYNYYNTYDGLHTNEFNGASYPGLVKLSNGFYSLPTISGLVWINPDKIRDLVMNSDILIEDVIADNVYYDPEQPIAFDEDISRLTLNFSMVYWGNHENISIKYKMEGVDKAWTLLNSPYSISYSHLPGGHHVLDIMIENYQQPDHFTHKKIYIDIPLKYYQKWWFYVLITMAFIGILMLYSNFRTRWIKLKNIKLEQLVKARTAELIVKNQKINDSLQLLEKKQEALDQSISIKDRAMSVFSHNIVGPLKFITILTNNMLKGKSETDMEKLSTIDLTSKSLLQHSVDLLTWVKTQDEHFKVKEEAIPLNEFVLQKIQLFKPIAESSNIKFDINISESIQLFTDKQLLNIILYNIVDNAIKHTNNGVITIEATQTPEDIQLIFTDTGAGMPMEQVFKLNEYHIQNHHHKMKNAESQNGFGVGWFIIADCLSLLKASYTVTSELDKGTEIILNFPV